MYHFSIAFKNRVRATFKFAALVVLTTILGVNIVQAQTPIVGVSMEASSVLDAMGNAWKIATPLQVSGRITSRTNKVVRARRDATWHLINPGVASPLGLLKSEVKFEWSHDGQRIIAKKNYVSPTSLASSGIAEGEKWQNITLWDGKRYIFLQPQSGNSTMEVTIIPAELESAESERYTIAKFGSDLLLFAPTGQSWSEYLKAKTLTLTPKSWKGLPCIELVWQETKDRKSAIYVIPSRNFSVARQEWRSADDDVLVEIEVASFQEKGVLWIPTEVHHTVYTRDKYEGKHLQKSSINYSVNRWLSHEEISEVDFTFDSDQLPRGSRISDLGKSFTYYKGAEITDADVARLSETLKQYLNDVVSLREVEATLPEQKKISYPFNCGPYSLLSICHMLGSSTTSKELAQLAKTNDEGITTIAGLVEALGAKGFNAKAYEMSLEDLRSVKLPAILHVAPEHFSVLLSINSDTVVLLDPPTRVVQMTTEDFLKTWSKRVVVIDSEITRDGKLQGNSHSESLVNLPPVEADPTAVVGLAIPKVEVGQVAPEVSFLDMNGQTRRLSDLRGKKNLLLTFFPRCFTGGCAGQLASLRDMQSDFAATDTEIWAVSVDPAEGEKGQVAFAKFLNLNFPLIPDTERELSSLYGATQDKQQLAARMSVVIDKSGIVRVVDTHVHIATHGADMLEKMRDLGMTK